jgi:RNase H-like domain found in reverse transcriptase/Reverse transcriptase (RNA-dependent DNA polymerase)/Integrase zinc binding domain/Retroviral aspartyl protease
LHYSSLRSVLRSHSHPQKRIKLSQVTPMLYGLLQDHENKALSTKIKILFDSGASKSIINDQLIPQNKLKRHQQSTVWTTVAGKFETCATAVVAFKIPVLHESRVIQSDMHVVPHMGKYDIIIGRDLLQDLGIILNFKDKTIQWEHGSVPMPSNYSASHDIVNIDSESQSIIDATNRVKKIIEAKCEKANLPEIVCSCTQLGKLEQQQLLQLLDRHQSLFDGTLGHWKDQPYDIKLKDGVKPYHARPYPIPKIHESTLKMEVDRLCQIGVLKKINRSQWGSPTFIIPKKDGTVRFISDFRELNKRIQRQPFPLPKIQDLLLKLEGFQYATSLDLNMGYYHIELSAQSKELCTIVLPWGKYEYQRLPMGLCNSPDIFQEKMSILMADLEYVRAYIDDLLILTRGSFLDHLQKLHIVLSRLEKAGLKINAKKSFFAQDQLEYLGYWITRQGIQPSQKKVEAIQAIQTPSNKRDLRRFIGMVNYYRDLWIRRSDVLAPLAALTSKTTKWTWTDVHQKAFELMKQIVSKETLLSYPNFRQPFDIYTDASKTQLGAVISQENRPIAFYSRKLSAAQTRYTTMERELLAIVETLKEFRNILLGQQIRVYTDHQNLTFKHFNTERVMRWRLIIEEFGPEFNYIKGPKNIVADALSRLSLKEPLATQDINTIAEYYGTSSEDIAYPLTYPNIQKEQLADSSLQETASSSPHYHLHSFRGGEGPVKLLCYQKKIVVPDALQRQLVLWYHEQLCHPGETRTEQTIRQHFWFPKLREMVHSICSKCITCQKNKISFKKYGHLPPKEAEAEPWEKLCVDLIGPYTVKRAKKDPLNLWAVTMIDPATGWLEIKEIPNKKAITIAETVEQVWLTRYPKPQVLNFDRGSEFMAEFAEMITNDYGIVRKGSTVRNPQSNAIIERVHQTIGNILRTFPRNLLNKNNPWGGILAATMFAVRATYHTTMQATPMQLVFGRDALLNTKFEANWALIKQRKQEMIESNNKRENSGRIRHTYKEHDKVLYKVPTSNKFGEDPWQGPYPIIQVNDNGTVRLQMDKVIDTVNIRNIKPFKE